MSKLNLKPKNWVKSYFNGIVSGFVGGFAVIIFIKWLDANDPILELKWLLGGIFMLVLLFFLGFYLIAFFEGDFIIKKD